MKTPRLTEVFGLDEAKCPLCGTAGAYQSFNSMECPNPKCKNHKSDKSHSGGSKQKISWLQFKAKLSQAAEALKKNCEQLAKDDGIDPSDSDEMEQSGLNYWDNKFEDLGKGYWESEPAHPGIGSGGPSNYWIPSKKEWTSSDADDFDDDPYLYNLMNGDNEEV